MRKYILLLTALFSWLLADLFIGQAQEQVHPALKSPRGISAPQHTSDDRGFNEHRMYPLGFSKKGDFAYLTYSALPWRQPTVNLIILNLVTDQHIHREVFSAHSGELDEVIGDLVSTHGKRISDILDKFEIAATAPLPVGKFPLRINGDLIEARVYRSAVSDKSPEDCGGRAPEEVQVRLVSRKNGSKVIASYDTCASHTPYIEAVEGFMKSPLENRIVVLASGVQYNSENSWDAKFFPIGAHLIDGF